jgi:phospholipid transport system transporter-binding protein
MSMAMSRFETGTTLTLAGASAALAAGLARIEAGALGVDCAPLVQYDSSALAVLLAWQRAAQARGASFDIANLPAGLAALAAAYGVDALVAPRHRNAHDPVSASA